MTPRGDVGRVESPARTASSSPTATDSPPRPPARRRPSTSGAGPPARRRRERAPRETVDVHAHCAVPEAMALLSQKVGTPAAAPVARGRSALQGHGRAGHRRRGAQHQPLLVQAERDVRAEADRDAEREAGGVLRGAPERFVAFASVALQHPDLAAQQLEEGGQEIRAARRRRSAAASAARSWPIPKFHPFWAKVEQLGVLVFIHPQATGAPSRAREPVQGQRLAATTRSATRSETTIALSHLIFEGTLDRFPGLKICAAHGGGYLPSYAGTVGRGAARPSPIRHHAADRGRSRRSISGSSTTTRSSSRPRRCGTWWPRPARARSSWAPTIRSRGRRRRWTTSSPRRA